MKRNILTIIIMALCLVNLVMTALLIFTIVPTTKKTDALISQVASVIQLELKGYEDASYNVEDVENHKIEESLTKNLKVGEDGKVHFAVLDYVTVTLNKKSEDYGTLKALLDSQNSKIMDIVGTILTQHTYEEAVSNQSEIKKEALEQLRKHFGSSDFIVDIYFGNFVCQ